MSGGGDLIIKLCPILVTPMDYKTCQAPLSMGFPRQEYWSRLLFPSAGDLPDPGIEPASPASAGGLSTLSHQGSPVSSWKFTSQKQPTMAAEVEAEG